MKIKSIEIENFRGIRHAKLDIKGKSVVLFGDNGAGKSSVLSVCDLLFFPLFQKLSGSNLGLSGKLSIQNTDCHLDASAETKLQIAYKIGKKEHIYWRSMYENKRRHFGKGLEGAVEAFLDLYVGDQFIIETDETDEEPIKNGMDYQFYELNNNNIPIYSTYGVNRYELKQIEKIEEDNLSGKTEAWRNCFCNTANFQLFFEWYRGRQEYVNSNKVEDASFEDKQLQCVQNAILNVLGEEYTEVKVRITENSAKLIVVKSGMELELMQLSEGEKCVIALVGDLARKLAIANPSKKNPLEGEGIVLIDELDLHLHPSWQSKIFQLLMGTFPGIQFIVTTHSPRILGEIDENVLIYEMKNQDGIVSAEPHTSMRGWDMNNILELYMHTNKISPATKKMLDEIYDAIDAERYEEAEQMVNRYAAMTDDLNLDVVRARVLIAKGR